MNLEQTGCDKTQTLIKEIKSVVETGFKPKLCRNCKYHIPHKNNPWDCSNPESRYLVLVDGKLLDVTCKWNRSDEGECKPDGLLFTEKDDEYFAKEAARVKEEKRISMFGLWFFFIIPFCVGMIFLIIN